MHYLSLPKPVVVAMALALASCVGAVDFVTGRHFSLSAFYLLPICWATWKVGRRAGVALALFSSIAWLAAHLVSGFDYKHPVTPYWDAFMLAILFVVVACLLSAFQQAQYHLEATVQLRTAALRAEIAERKRLEAAKLQSERLAALGTMATEVAHEVRNPLGSIALNLDMVQNDFNELAGFGSPAVEEGIALVEEMRAEVKRIGRVTEDCLRFVRQPDLKRDTLALNDLLSEKLAFMNCEFVNAGVRLRTAFDPALPMIRADRERIWQATLNLIRNALEAVSCGSEVIVTTSQKDGVARLQVTDNGKGLTDEQRGQIFTPFFSCKPQGTGLGLVLVQQIATEHGGYVECESTLGKGSAFTIFLPTIGESHHDEPA